MLSAQLVSGFGSGLRMIAIPLLAAASTNSPGAITAISVAGSLPGVLLWLPAGLVVDRWHRGRLLLAGDLTSLTVMIVLTAVTAIGRPRLWWLVGSSGLLALADMVFSTAVFAAVPILVEPSKLVRSTA